MGDNKREGETDSADISLEIPLILVKKNTMQSEANSFLVMFLIQFYF